MPVSKSCNSGSMLEKDVDKLEQALRLRALTPFRWIELCLSCTEAGVVLNEVLCSLHSSDDATDTFLVADPVVLEALWSVG